MDKKHSKINKIGPKLSKTAPILKPLIPQCPSAPIPQSLNPPIPQSPPIPQIRNPPIPQSFKLADLGLMGNFYLFSPKKYSNFAFSVSADNSIALSLTNI